VILIKSRCIFFLMCKKCFFLCLVCKVDRVYHHTRPMFRCLGCTHVCILKCLVFAGSANLEMFDLIFRRVINCDGDPKHIFKNVYIFFVVKK